VAQTLLHLATSTLMIVIVVGVSRARRLPLRSFLALRWPGARQAAYWVVLFVLLVIAEEMAAGPLGLSESEPWAGRYAGWLLALRIVGMVILAPAGEELVFRGAGTVLVPILLHGLGNGYAVYQRLFG
jgi:membrane protease YdiL (CAAX protease family)